VAAPPLDPDTLAWLRTQVGDTPDDDELAEVYDQQVVAGAENPRLATARAVLSKRLANFSASPTSFTTPDYGQNVAANISALQKQLEILDSQAATSEALPGVQRNPMRPAWRER
jgi:hypothetical protein